MNPALRRLAYSVMTRTPAPVLQNLQTAANQNPRLRPLLRRLTGAVRSGAHPIASGPARGLLMDIAGSRPSYLTGSAEPDVVRFLQAHVKPGDTVFDLGANVGYFTLIAAQLAGPAGKVVAFEPIPSNAEALRRNVQLNNLSNVEVVEAAVSGRAGEAAINVASSDQESSLIARRDAGTMVVRTVSLDDEAERVGFPAVIKSDIEGGEYEAFAAAGRVLERRPAIMCEVHQFADGDRERFLRILEPSGFTTEWTDDQGWTAHVIAT